MRAHQTFTISLPAEIAQQVENTMRAEHRSRSELVCEAFRTYIRLRQIPEEAPTAAELRAIRRGRVAYQHRDYVTLDELRREEAVAFTTY